MQLPKKSAKRLSSAVPEVAPQPVALAKNDGFQMLQVKYTADSSVIRHLFVKQFSLLYHKNTSDEKPENRTLTVINVPPFVTDHHVRYLFEKRCGKIERIFLQEKPSLNTATSVYNRIQTLRGGDEEMDTDEQLLESVSKYFSAQDDHIMAYKVCYIVFQKPAGLANALKMASDQSEVYSWKPSKEEFSTDDSLKETNFFTGMNLWQQQYNDSIVAPWQAKKVAENFLAKYKERAEKEEAREKAEAEAGPDDDGWVTVNRKLKRDKQALVSNQFKDQKIKDKYLERERKRKADEAKFEESVDKSMLETGKKKKRKGGRFNTVDFLKDN